MAIGSEKPEIMFARWPPALAQHYHRIEIPHYHYDEKLELIHSYRFFFWFEFELIFFGFEYLNDIIIFKNVTINLCIKDLCSCLSKVVE